VLCSLQSAYVIYMWREANSTAHYLARAVVTHVIDSIWLKETPVIVYDIVHRECIVPQC
jgi:hypothetical protein